MKRLLALVLAVCCLVMFALASCSKNEEQNEGEQINAGQKDTSNIDANGGSDENAEGYKFSIDDKMFVLPCTIEHFLNSGYEFSERDSDRILTKNDGHVNVELLKDDVRVCNLYVVKDGDNINDAKVFGAMLDEDCWGATVAFENLQIGTATLEDAIDTLGEPVNDYDETTTFTALKYDIGEDANLSVTVSMGVVVAVYYWEEMK